MSALVSKLGADCSLLVSPLKVSWHDDDELELLRLELLEPLPDMDDFNKLHGMATCLPALDEVSPVLEEGLVVEDVGLVVEDGLVEDDVDELEDEPELLSDSTANSTLPELGLMIVSLMVPRFSPDDD